MEKFLDTENPEKVTKFTRKILVADSLEENRRKKDGNALAIPTA